MAIITDVDDSITIIQPSFIALGVGTSIILYVLGTAIYNVWFHPLSRFPGPKLRAAFWWPDLWSIWTGNHLKDIYNIHRKYGPTVRISPGGLSSTETKVWKDVYGSRPGKGQMQKDSRGFVANADDATVSDIVISNDTDHSRFRRALSHAFSEQALRGQESILNDHYNLLIKKLNEQIDGPNNGKVDLLSWFTYLSFDIIGDLSLGESFGSLEGGKYHPWVATSTEAIKFLRWYRVTVRYPILQAVLKAVLKLVPGAGEARAKHFAYTKERVDKRVDNPTNRKDFWSFVLSNSGEKSLSRGEMHTNASVLIFAGSETVATALSGATFFLLQHPDKLTRLQEEVRSSFSSLDEITLQSTSQLPYLHAVIEETMRLYPPAPDLFHRVVPPEGSLVAGNWLPGNTTIAVHQYSANRDPTHFAQPDKFIPERFLPDKPAQFDNDNRDVLQPFSVGPRNCIGRNLAWNEMRSAFARLMWAFDIAPSEGLTDWMDQKVYFAWNKPPLFVHLSRSKNAS